MVGPRPNLSSQKPANGQPCNKQAFRRRAVGLVMPALFVQYLNRSGEQLIRGEAEEKEAWGCKEWQCSS